MPSSTLQILGFLVKRETSVYGVNSRMLHCPLTTEMPRSTPNNEPLALNSKPEWDSHQARACLVPVRVSKPE